VFKTEKDAKAFNEQLDAIAKQLDAIAQLQARLASPDQGLAHH